MKFLNDKRNETEPYTNEVTGSDSYNSLDNNQLNSNNAGVSGSPLVCLASDYMLSGRKNPEGLFPHRKVFCKAYSCPFCGPKKVFLVQKAIEKAIGIFNLTVFATLTLDPKKVPGQQKNSADYIRKAWNKFRIRQKRDLGKAYAFVAVLEFQKNGYAHLHVLFDGFIDQAWLKEAWNAMGGGTIVHVRKADAGAARYLAKYLGKELLSGERKKHRAYSTSQGIKLMQLVKRAAEDGVTFSFCKVSEGEARNILRPFITGDLKDSKNRILGFLATRRLGGNNDSQRNVTLESEEDRHA